MERKNKISAVILVIVLVFLWIISRKTQGTSGGQEIEFTAKAEGIFRVAEAEIQDIPYSYVYKGRLTVSKDGEYYLTGDRRVTLDNDVNTEETEGYGLGEQFYCKRFDTWEKQEERASELCLAKESSEITKEEFLSFFGEVRTYLGGKNVGKVEHTGDGDVQTFRMSDCVGMSCAVGQGEFELEELSLTYSATKNEAAKVTVPKDTESAMKKVEKEAEFASYNSAEDAYVYTEEGTYLIKNSYDTLVEVKTPGEGYEDTYSSEYYVECEQKDLGIKYSVEFGLAGGTVSEDYLKELGGKIKQCEAKDGRICSYCFYENEESERLELRVAIDLSKGQYLEICLNTSLEYVRDMDGVAEEYIEEIEKENREAEEKNRRKREIVNEEAVQGLIDNIAIYDE